MVWPISSHWSLSSPPQNIRKPEDIWNEIKCINEGNFLRKCRTFKLIFSSFDIMSNGSLFLSRRTTLTFSRHVTNIRQWKGNVAENENLEKLKSLSLGIKRIAPSVNFPPENHPLVNCLPIYCRKLNTLHFSS